MLIFHIILVLAFLGFVLAGWKDGVIPTLGRLIGSFIGFVLGRSFAGTVAPLLALLMPEKWAGLAAFVAIFFFANRLVGFIFGIAEHIFRILSYIPILKSINSLLGSLAGILEGVVVLGAIVWVLNTYQPIQALQPILSESVMVKYLSTVFNFVADVGFKI